jgi:hypothetical protein
MKLTEFGESHQNMPSIIRMAAAAMKSTGGRDGHHMEILPVASHGLFLGRQLAVFKKMQGVIVFMGFWLAREIRTPDPQKGLAFRCDRSATVLASGALLPLRDPAPPAEGLLRGFGGAAGRLHLNRGRSR